MNANQMKILSICYAHHTISLSGDSSSDINALVDELLIERNGDSKGIDMYRITCRGKVWMEHVIHIPLPKSNQQWIM